MAKYVVVTIEQFREVLKADKGWQETIEAGTKEYVFLWPIKECPGIVLKVYSSVTLASGAGRKRGGDAIRVCAINTVLNTGYVRMPRVHRVEQWRYNLRARVMQALREARKRYGCVKKGVAA